MNACPIALSFNPPNRSDVNLFFPIELYQTCPIFKSSITGTRVCPGILPKLPDKDERIFAEKNPSVRMNPEI